MRKASEFLSIDWVPSGKGKEGVKYAIREMLEPRLLVKNRD